MNKSNLSANRHAQATTAPEHTAASNSAARDRGKLISHMHNLEAALAAASFNRIEDWNDIVRDELIHLQNALRESRKELNSSSGLFSEITVEHPRLLPRIEKLQQEFEDLERQIQMLREQFKRSDQQIPEVADIRERLSWLLKALRHAQVKENELVFEAIGRDLGGGD